MTSKFLAISAVVCVGVIGAGFYMNHKTDKEYQALMTAIENIGSKLPQGYTQTNEHNKTFFKTDGVYTLLSKDENNKSTAKIVLKYGMKHGIGDVLSDSYPVNIDVQVLNEPTVVLSDVNAPSAKISGTYTSSGLTLLGKSQDMTVKMKDSNTEFKSIGQEFNINYDKVLGDVGFKFKIAKLEDEQLGEIFNNVQIDLKYNMLNALVGSLGVSADSVEQGYATFKDLNFMFNVGEKDNSIDAGLKIKIGDIRSVLLEDKVFALDMDVAVGKIDADFYRKLAHLWEVKNSETEPTEIEALESTTTTIRALHSMYKKGLTFDINKLHLKTNTDELKTNFHLVVLPEVKENDLVGRTSFTSDLYLKSDVLSSSLNFVPPELHDLFKDNRNEFSLGVEYKNSHITTSSKFDNKESEEYIKSLLLNLEEGINQTLTAFEGSIDAAMLQNEQLEESLKIKKSEVK